MKSRQIKICRDAERMIGTLPISIEGKENLEIKPMPQMDFFFPDSRNSAN